MSRKLIDFHAKGVTILSEEQLKTVKGGKRKDYVGGGPGCPPDYEDE